MVASNPLFVGSFSLRKLNATVLSDIWPEMILFTGIAVVVTFVSVYIHNLGISSSLLTVLGTILGLVISFRTSSAYDRYWEGRRLWTTVILGSRTLASLIWIQIPTDRPDKNPPKLPELPRTPRKENFPSGTARPTPLLTNEAQRKTERQLRAMLEKRTMVGLVQAFSIAVKHFLRGEPGVYYEDLYPLISFLPRHTSTGAGGQALASMFSPALEAPVLQRFRSGSVTSRTTGHSRHPSVTTIRLDAPHENVTTGQINGDPRKPPGPVDPEKGEVELLPAQCPPPTRIYDYLPILIIFKPLVWLVRKLMFWLRLHKDPSLEGDDRGAFGKKKRPAHLDGNVPLEICLYLSSYIAFVAKETLVPPPTLGLLLGGINALQDAFASLERIATTPIPFAYQAHLRMFTWLYLTFLPFQLYPSFGYLTIPAQALATFLIVGLVEIGYEIENPFNYDANDLDLDYFCNQIAHEIAQITSHTPPDPWDYLFNSENQPLAPGDMRSADVLLQSGIAQMGDRALDDARAVLHKNFLTMSPIMPQRGY